VLTLLQKGGNGCWSAVERAAFRSTRLWRSLVRGNDDKAVQVALQDAYESGKLRGKHCLQARRASSGVQTLGRSVARGTPRNEKR